MYSSLPTLKATLFHKINDGVKMKVVKAYENYK